MFKSAATKLAHNSTIPALGGNKDLRPLQDLITAEKAIVRSLARLSGDFVQASTALRQWGLGEGEDLSDTLGGCTKILLEFSSCISQFAAQEQSVREHMKAVRTQEEKLDEIKHRRKGVASKADSAERKLSKMDPQNKNTPTQSELLTRLRDEMRELDSQIMTEEARLCDLKRTATKSWMTLKFGGLQECCRKGLIIAETGKLIMTELSQLETVPGTPRPLYTGHPRTEIYVHDAMSALGEVLFDSSVPPDRVLSSQAVINQDGYRNLMLAVASDVGSATNLVGNRDMPLRHRTQYSHDASGSSSLAERRSNDNPPAAVQADELGSWSPQPDPPRSQTFSPPQNPPPPSSSTPVRDDLLSSPLQLGSPAAPGGRFATFPVKGKRKASLVPGTGEPQDGSKSTFSEEVEQAPIKDIEPSPRYEAIEGVPPPPLAPPPGAAPPAVPQEGPYGSFDPRVYNSGPSYSPVNAGEEDEDGQLAYLEPPQSERRVRFGSRPIQIPSPLLPEDPNGRTPLSTESDPRNLSSLASSPVSPPISAPQNHIPSPPHATEDPEDERALNAAAAREVSRELDALMYSPPPSRDPPSSPTSLAIPPPLHSSPRSSISSTHSSPFARTRGGRTPGSPTTPRSSTEQPSSNSAPPSQPAASDPSSPTQRALPPSIALPPASPPSLSSASTTPFRTPPELVSSASSVNSQRPLPHPPPISNSPGMTPAGRLGARTISAAAFRRPVPRVLSEPPTGTPETSPLSIKKRERESLRPSPLPSPYAARIGGGVGPFGTGSTPSLPSVRSPEPSPSSQSQSQERMEDDFDYISAYYISGGDDMLSPSVTSSETRGRSSSLR